MNFPIFNAYGYWKNSELALVDKVEEIWPAYLKIMWHKLMQIYLFHSFKFIKGKRLA